MEVKLKKLEAAAKDALERRRAELAIHTALVLKSLLKRRRREKRVRYEVRTSGERAQSESTCETARARQHRINVIAPAEQELCALTLTLTLSVRAAHPVNRYA